MKHLTTYQLFEARIITPLDQNIENNILDILQDCVDIELEIRVSEIKLLMNKKVDGLVVNIYTDPDKRMIIFSEIKDCINHLINYMLSIGYSKFIYCDNLMEFNDYCEDVNILPIDDEIVGVVELYFL